MSKPPKAPPHSDIDGVREDEERNIDKAIAAGEDSGDLAKAKKEGKGRPPYSDHEESRDDRTD